MKQSVEWSELKRGDVIAYYDSDNRSRHGKFLEWHEDGSVVLEAAMYNGRIITAEAAVWPRDADVVKRARDTKRDLPNVFRSAYRDKPSSLLSRLVAKWGRK